MYLKHLRCKECKREYPLEAIFACEWCFGPLEAVYDYEKVKKDFTKNSLKKRNENIWRYRELLPIEGDPTDGLNSGFTPFIRAKNLEKLFKIKRFYIKDDSVNYPTLSYKDRVVPVALSRAKELGYKIVGCASTGNLANAVSAHSAIANLKAFILIPADLEMGKVLSSLIYNPTLVAVKGNYDEVNRLCTEIVNVYPWAFVNVNFRPYYTEGAKTYGFEIAEQLGWRLPQNIVLPVAGGTLLPKVYKSFQELIMLGIVSKSHPKFFAAQPKGSSPVVTAILEKSDIIKPVKPKTIAKSLAIGNPADGPYAAKIVLDTGGTGEIASDEEIIEAIKILASEEGIFTETAGGVTFACAKKLIEKGIINKEEEIVVGITGNGLKTQEALVENLQRPKEIAPSLDIFKKIFKDEINNQTYNL